MRIPYKDEEDFLVRAPRGSWESWDWDALAEIADTCRWRGSPVEERYLM
jgi:hypothetical protein